MKALIIGDVHLSDRPPSVRTDDYADDILKKLLWCVQTAVDRGADVIIQDGDLFHVKTPSRTSHRLVQRVHDVITTSDLPWLILPGNHDLQHDRLDTLPAQPLGALSRMSQVRLLIGAASYPRHGDAWPVFGIPYLEQWDDLPQWMDRWQVFAADTPEHHTPLLVAHAPLFPPGEEPPYDYLDSVEWAQMMGTGVCIYGHIHDPHGIYQPHPDVDVTLINLGAISRGSLHEKTLAREPKVVWFDSKDMSALEVLDVPHRPVSEVFRLEDHERAVEQAERMTAFLDGIEETSFSVSSIEEVRAHVKTLGLSPGTVSAVEDLVEWAMSDG